MEDKMEDGIRGEEAQYLMLMRVERGYNTQAVIMQLLFLSHFRSLLEESSSPDLLLLHFLSVESLQNFGNFVVVPSGLAQGLFDVRQGGGVVVLHGAGLILAGSEVLDLLTGVLDLGKSQGGR